MLDLMNVLVNAKDPRENQQKQPVQQELPIPQTELPKQNQTKKQKKQSSNLSQILDEDTFMKILFDKFKKSQHSSMQYEKQWISSYDITCLCPRKAYFRFINASYDLVLYYPYTEIITKVGDAVHNWVQKTLADVYNNVESEIKFELKDEMLKGYIDLVYETADGKTVLLEIKTIGDEILDPNFQGKVPHWKQLAFYYWIWTEKLKKKCDIVQLFYLRREFKPVNTGNSKIMPFKILTVKDPTKLWNTFKDDLLWMIDTIKQSLKTKQVPKIPPERYELIKKEECGFCPYQKVCSKYPIQGETVTIETLF